MNLVEIEQIRRKIAEAEKCGDQFQVGYLTGFLKMYEELRGNGACTCPGLPVPPWKCSRCKALESADAVAKCFEWIGEEAA